MMRREKKISTAIYHIFWGFFFFREREGKGGRKGGRETWMCGCLPCAPYWGLDLQPRHVPWQGIKPATLCFTVWCSIHWATPARANILGLMLNSAVKKPNRLKGVSSLQEEWKFSSMGPMLDPYSHLNPAHLLKQYQAEGLSDLGRIKGDKSNQWIFLRECPFFFLFKHVLCRKENV